MHIVLGASGQVGSAVVANLVRQQQPVKGVIRDEKKAADLQKTGAAVAIADAHDLDALKKAFQDGTTLMALTPESGQEKDVIGETKAILDNYRNAVAASSIRKVVGLSSMGAQHENGTGNLEMSYWLEHAFTGLPIQTVFVRPAYYFSNWLMYRSEVEKEGILPTLFPPELLIPMVSPLDVAEFLADFLRDDRPAHPTLEIEGPRSYNSIDVANAFSEVLRKPVKAVQIERNQWEGMFQQAGFSEDGVRNFIEMTEAVISGRTMSGRNAKTVLKAKTELKDYIKTAVSA